MTKHKKSLTSELKQDLYLWKYHRGFRGRTGSYLEWGATVWNDVTDRWCKQMLQVISGEGGLHTPPAPSPLKHSLVFVRFDVGDWFEQIE